MEKTLFTLAEMPKVQHRMGFCAKGFTLAEVLITLGIIGIVAAITIPTLVSNYQSKAWNTAATVFERKLEESLKAMNTQQTLAGYSNTLDFVNELSKHFKISKICKNDDLMSCFEDKVFWGGGDADPEEVDMTNIKTASHFGQDDWGTDIVGVQFANGTTGLVAYNPDCTQNPYSNQVTGTSCLAILYDTSGFKTPNTSGKDLRAINVARLGSNCAFEINGKCFGAPFFPTAITIAECQALADEGYGNSKTQCTTDNDYWAGAVKACGGKDKLAELQDLVDIASEILHKEIPPTGPTQMVLSGTFDRDLVAQMGFNMTGSAFYVWSNAEFSSGLAYYRSYAIQSSMGVTATYDGTRSSGNVQAVCVSN